MSATAGHVFVSHSSDNRQLASELAAFLEGRGVRIWIAPRDVRPGMDYSEELQRAIEQSVAFVVLVTDMANKSPYVRAETEMAFSSHKPIFPVRTADLQPAPGLAFFLKIRHWTDAFGNARVDNLNRLVRELQALSGIAAPATTPPTTTPPASAAAPPPAAPAPAPPPPPPSPAPAGAQAFMSTEAVAAPATPAPATSLLPTTPEEEEAWRIAIDKNPDYYLGRWRAMAAKGSAISWNWPACFFNLFWFGYRKMWLPMIGMIVAVLVFGVIGAAAGESGGAATSVLGLLLSAATGAFGNHLYLKQTGRLVAETAALPKPARLDALRSRGGVSAPALAILLVVFGLLTLAGIVGAAVEQMEQNQLNSYQAYPPVDGGQGGAQGSTGTQGSTGAQGQAGDSGDTGPSGAKPPIDDSEVYIPGEY